PYMGNSYAYGASAVFFVLTTNPKSSQVWKTDGTMAGTLQLKDFGVNNNLGISAVPFGGKLYLGLGGGTGSFWSTDGTVMGTVQVLPTYVAQSFIFPFQNKMLFAASNNAGP